MLGHLLTKLAAPLITAFATSLTTWLLKYLLVEQQVAGFQSAGVSLSGSTLSFTLANPQQVVQFEVGMTLQASSADGGAAAQNVSGTIDAIQVTSVNRGTGAISGTVVQGAPGSSWAAGYYLQVLGDIGIGGSSTVAGMLGLSGLAAWVPASDPPSSDNFWGVNRSADPTRLGGLALQRFYHVYL
jgi:hypothetical protein